MHWNRSNGLVVGWLILGAILACTLAHEAVAQQAVSMKAENYKFIPDHIRAQKGTDLQISIENVSATMHNITVKDPKGNILASVDLPPKETRIVSVNLTQAGIYPFNCDKFLHTTLGMKGEIEVSD